MSDLTSPGSYPPPAIPVPGSVLRTEEAGPVSLRKIPATIRRQKLLILLLAMAFSVVFVAFACLVPVHYAAIATVLIDTRQVGIEPSQADIGKINTDAVAIRTQVDVLTSPSLARKVVMQLKLVDAPEFAKVLSPHPSELAQAIRTTVAPVLEQIGLKSEPPLTAPQKIDRAVDLLLEKMKFTNDGRSYVIGVEAKTKDAQLSAAIANTYSAAYLDYTRNRKVEALRRANSWFDQRLDGLQENFRNANLAVQEFRAKTGLVEDLGATNGASSAVTVTAQQLSQINTQLIMASNERAEKEASLQQVQAAIRGQSSPESIPAVVQSRLIQELRTQQAQVDRETASSGTIHSSLYPGLQSSQSEQSSIRARIAAEVRNIATSISNEASTARAREASLRQMLAELKGLVSGEGQDQIHLRELQTTADAARTIYLSYLDLYQKTANQSGLQQPDAELVSPAAVPLDQALPTRPQLVAFAVLLAFIAAVLMAARRDLGSNGFRTAEEFEAQASVPILGSVPLLKRRTLWPDKTNERHFREAITLTLSVLLHRGGGKAPQVVLVTSALPGEGKTFLAVSLARSAVAAGHTTLVIDCDLRHPSVAVALGGDAKVEVANLDAFDGAALTATRPSNARLNVVSAKIGGIFPQEFFSSPEMLKLLERARASYDLIIMDAPPVLVFADARVLSSLADSTVMVVRWRKTPRKLVAGALDALAAHGARIRGVVINAVVLAKLSSSESSHAYVLQKYPNYFTS